MSSITKKVDPPSEDSIRFWAGSLAKEWMLAVDRQVARLRDSDVFSWSTDIHFLVVALRRLQRAAILGMKVPAAHDIINDAIERFEAALPGYVVMRNASEHLDDYVMGRGREEKVNGLWVQNVRRQSLQSGSFDGTTFEWVGVYDEGPVKVFAPVSETDGTRRFFLNIDRAFDAALDLSLVVRALHPETAEPEHRQTVVTEALAPTTASCDPTTDEPEQTRGESTPTGP